ncbi:I78 family peptidase inhibitor [Asticcacaulis sp. W401b]|uniref:I78 family peptidase inhibitor n=1 Tax=Asticcacaulis sp. W401b TaxID=3388666 RepID=UPI0039710D05
MCFGAAIPTRFQHTLMRNTRRNPMRVIFPLISVSAMAGLAACASLPASDGAGSISPPPANGECRVDDAKALEGQTLPTEVKIKALTGASTVRVVGPNDMVTQDFRVERVTIIVDPLTRKILRANCG